MTDRILVTYATFTGSTAEVAEAIGRTLTEHGAQVDVLPVQEVTDLSPYRAVVMGSAIQSGRWLKEAMDFLRRHQVTLQQKPFATFTVCLVLTMKNKTLADAKQYLNPVRQLVTPVEEGYFAGRLDLARIPSRLMRLSVRLNVWTGIWKEGDHRDWDTIKTWADDLAVKLEVEP